MSEEEKKEILDKRVAIKKIRCKNWPNCTDPKCIYSHPTETVSKKLILKFKLKIFKLVSLFSKLFIWR